MSNTKKAVADDDRRWSLVQQRDRSAARAFIYAVKTTGVYCRVGCSSRLPRRENVAFFADVWQARAAGFRPCKRCQPDADEPQLEHGIGCDRLSRQRLSSAIATNERSQP